MKLPEEPIRRRGNILDITLPNGSLIQRPSLGLECDLIDRINALHSLCEQLKEDAERYRWLRQHPTFLGWDEDYSDSGIDLEVDAARKESDDKA